MPYLSRLLLMRSLGEHICTRWDSEKHSGCACAMAGRALIKMFDPVITWMAKRYQAAVAENLRRHGLRYEDLYDPLLNQVPAVCCPACSSTGSQAPRCAAESVTLHASSATLRRMWTRR